MEGANALMTAVTSALGTVLEWFGTVIGSLLTADGALNPLLPIFAVGIVISVIMLGVKVVRRTAWGA